MKNTVQVTLFGQQYALKSEAPPEEVERVAAFVNEKLSQVSSAGSSGDSLNTAVLALLNVAGAYLQLKDAGASSDDFTEWLHVLSARMERSGIPLEGD